MDLMRPLAVVAALLAVCAAAAKGFDILQILGKHDEFSQFCKLLNETHLAGDINRDRTITVLAVANGDMGHLTSGHYSLGTIRHILELHVVADYYDEKKLKQLSHGATAASTLFQRSGFAPGMAGYVNITQHRGGKVTFIVDDAADSVKPVTFVKQIESHRYDYSVLQVSSVLSSPEAEAPVAPPVPVNLTNLLSKKYCKSFAGLLAADAKAFDTINGTKDTALTLFCPVDAAVAAFMPKFKNLTAKAKTAILLYHAVPDYYSMQFLKSNKGKVTTLATTSVAKKDYTYEAQTEADTVTLDTTVTTSTIQATVRDDDPLAIYAVSKFLQPKELFKSKTKDLAPAPAPEGPKKKTKKKPSSTSAAAAPADDEPADGPAADDSADDAADKAGAAPSLLARWVTAAATVAAALALAA
ncbi:fasciclin-like arabinogalactan protein 2 [Panicum miliaceum]|uniref:Fasciclin-like arabinogalactan protein 2 n=1 Tax=Panicum miliaceum TaxID=4540 RepID=A0A3L6PPW3_PANMI|nr:fasciclin-like arabinogalactan protein 2 [Panicum miliaceum]